MFSKLDKVIRRVLKNKNQMLCISVITIVTMLITIHLSPPIVVRNINNKTVNCVIFILLLAISIYYKSFMLGLVVILSAVLINNYNKSLEINGYSDDSIFSQVNQLTELYENKSVKEFAVAALSLDDYQNQDVTGMKSTIPLPSENMGAADEVEKEPESSELSLQEKITQALQRVQNNIFPDKSKKTNTQSPVVGTNEYFAQGDLDDKDAPLGCNVNNLSSYESV